MSAFSPFVSTPISTLTAPVSRLGVATLAILCLAFTGCANRVTITDRSVTLDDPASDLAAAEAQWRRIRSGDRSTETLTAYRDAVSRLIRQVRVRPPREGESAPRESSLTLGGRPIPVTARLTNPEDLAALDAIIPADLVTLKGFTQRHVSDEFGAPVVLHFPPEGYSAKEGRFQPASVLLDFSEGNDLPRLVVHDTLADSTTNTFSVGGRSLPLRTDFTTPLAARFAAQDEQFINIPALLRPDKYDTKLGLSRVHATYPGKIPVVFVHGLKSSPLSWRNALNELMADPEIRDHYEFWTFGYSTGVPIPYSAMKLREALHGMEGYRGLLGAETDEVILIGHSMGGLISRLMTERSGDGTWFDLFNKPVEELPLPEEERELLRKMAYFDPVPFVDRVVFIATPHGGSLVADNAIGQISSALIKLPTQLLSLSTSMLAESVSILTPLGLNLLQHEGTSISQLETDSEILLRLKAEALNPDVTFHSIIGDLSLNKPLLNSSDGVVPYESAHLEGVASEKVVSSSHNAHQNDEAIAEVRRILKAHLGR